MSENETAVVETVENPVVAELKAKRRELSKRISAARKAGTLTPEEEKASSKEWRELGKAIKAAKG